jgi:hypothetical protein
MGTKGIRQGDKLNKKFKVLRQLPTLSLSNCFAGSLNPEHHPPTSVLQRCRRAYVVSESDRYRAPAEKCHETTHLHKARKIERNNSVVSRSQISRVWLKKNPPSAQRSEHVYIHMWSTRKTRVIKNTLQGVNFQMCAELSLPDLCSRGVGTAFGGNC